ncbi:MAG: hypothetical protein LBT09_03860, partial [Planctomycetaceae bacterium]|nr:hypothetical protein [Planctomycetaceae bacterium]
MFRIFLTASLVICAFAIELAADETKHNTAKNNSKITITLEIFPKEIKIGDTLYCVIKATNDSDIERHTASVVNPDRSGLFSYIGFDEIKNFVFDGEKKWEIYPYMTRAAHVDMGNLKRIIIAPRSSAVVFTYDIRLVSLEDLYDPFWLDVQKNLSQQGNEMEFRVEFLPYMTPIEAQRIFKEKIRILPREKNEMKLLNDWYQNTPKHLFPELNSDDIYNTRRSQKWLRKKLKGERVGDKIFVMSRNLYPGYPNLPKDWQGWKKLEESFEHGTLRDEIRWTRICIQYCSTGNEKVLDELKTWLDKMNPIQR